MIVNLYLVRHAHAGIRGRWDGLDHERPLSAKGWDQANDIMDALEHQPITRVVSSPAVRCTQTVEGLADRHGLTLEISDALRESAHYPDARALIDELAKGGDAVVCSHGDVLPELLAMLANEGVVTNGAGCAKGSLWHVIAHNGRFERATYYRHPERGILAE